MSLKLVFPCVVLLVVASGVSFAASATEYNPFKLSPNAVNCRSLDLTYPGWQDSYPCTDRSDKLYLKLDTGNFAFWPRTDGRVFDDYIRVSWGPMTVSQEASGKLSVVSRLTGQVGVSQNEGNGAYCLGEESSNRLLDPDAIQDGHLSFEKMRKLALKRAVIGCTSQGGTLKMNGSDVVVVGQINASEHRVRSLGDGLATLIPAVRKCLSSTVVIECDISSHADQMVEIYRDFLIDDPANPLATDSRFELFK